MIEKSDNSGQEEKMENHFTADKTIKDPVRSQMVILNHCCESF